MSAAGFAPAAPSRPLPPGPKGHPLLGHIGEWNRDSMGFLARCARERGDVVPIRLGPARMVVFSHPDLVEQVLVAQHANFNKGEGHRLTRSLLGNGLLSSEGDFWLRQRRLAQPAFHRERIAAYAETMVARSRTASMVANWLPMQTRGPPPNGK